MNFAKLVLMAASDDTKRHTLSIILNFEGLGKGGDITFVKTQ
jgi:hypothetical protein